jgi:hypothetical protein
LCRGFFALVLFEICASWVRFLARAQLPNVPGPATVAAKDLGIDLAYAGG